jgi:hypothetical protein
MARSTQYDPLPFADFDKVPALVKQGICTQTGLLPNPSCKVIVAPFLPGTAPKGACAVEHPAIDPGENPAAHLSLWKRDAGEPAQSVSGGE